MGFPQQHYNVGGGSSSSGRFALLDRNEVENEIDVLSGIHNPRLVNLVGVSTYDDGIAGAGAGAVGDDAAPSSSPALGARPSSSSSSFRRRRERLLVVEYMPNGTLYDLLHSNPNPPSWGRRLRLALQTAKALHALHSGDLPVIHRDVKSANVLIDARFHARLGDFGLALRATDDGKFSSSSPFSSTSARSTPPAGTLGYLDPGYITPENLSTKTDVFSFGILLLEMMSGRKAIDVAHSPPSVVEWAVPLLRKGKVLALYDPRIPPPKDPAARRQLASLAASCVRSCKEKRPSMEEVVVCLKLLGKVLPSKSWTTGLSVRNPCLVVEAAERSHSLKPSLAYVEECPNLSPVVSCVSTIDEFEETAADEMPTSSKRSPSSSKAVHPLWNARKAVSEWGPRSRGGGGSNLIDLMMAPDEETLKVIGHCHQRSTISRARTLHLSRDNDEKNCMLHLRRNQSMRVDADVLSRLDVVRDLDGKAATK
uniref:Serine/threonine-protein kinase-like protein At3g51990 n=1 Tax=Anthurium amnicola TaxID=1678845 RepID=A0A1D1XMT7_9ARAE